MSRRLETDRLLLEPWTDVAVETYQALVAERGQGTPAAEDIEQRLHGQRERYRTDGIALLALRRRAERDVIGYCGLVVGRSTPEEPELAYELFRRVHGAGYATEAATAVVGAARATGRGRLWATVRNWNTASLRVLDKLGFVRDRTTSDDAGEIIWCSRELSGRPFSCHC